MRSRLVKKGEQSIRGGMGWDILCVRGGWERNQTRAELRASAHPADIKRQIKDIKRHALKISCKWAALTTNRSL